MAIKSNRVTRPRHVARMGELRNTNSVLVGTQAERNCYGHQDVNTKLVLKLDYKLRHSVDSTGSEFKPMSY